MRSSVDKEDYSLTPDQMKAFAALKRAFARCNKEGVYVWDNYGFISAVNSYAINSIICGYGEEEIDDMQVESFSPKGYRGSNADDPLYVER